MNEILYIESANSLLEKIEKIDIIIDALLTQMELSASGSNIEEYSVDDGQIKIKTAYRDPVSMANAIFRFEQMRGRLLNKLNGSSFILKSRRGLM